MSLLASSVRTVYQPTGQNRKVGGKDKGVLMPAGQAGGKIFTPTVQLLSSTYPSNIFNSASKYRSNIPNIDFINHMLLKVTVVVSGAPVTLVPCNYWFKQIDLCDSSTSRVIQTQYDDTAQSMMLNRITAGREKALFKTTNIESDDQGKYNVTKPLQPGTYDFYIPLMTSVFENFGGLYIDDLLGYICIDLYTNNTIIASGSGTISTTISFQVEGAKLNESDVSYYRSIYRMYAPECKFLMATKTDLTGQTLTCGSANNYLLLNNVDGLCAYQLLMVRPSGCYGNNVGYNSWKLLNLGDANGAAIDLVNNAGVSLWGNGNPVPTRFIRQHQSVDHFDNEWVSENPAYYISYTDSILKSMYGMTQGGVWFDQTRGDRLQLSLPAAAVQEVQTVLFSSTPSVGGFYSFSFRGESSAQLSASASPSQMATAINAMRGVAGKFITAVASASLSAGASFSLTFTDPQGVLTGDLFSIVNHDGLGASSSTVRTVAGVAGLPGSGQYDVMLYSFIYQEAGYTGTKLTSQQLMLPGRR